MMCSFCILLFPGERKIVNVPVKGDTHANGALMKILQICKGLGVVGQPFEVRVIRPMSVSSVSVSVSVSESCLSRENPAAGWHDSMSVAIVDITAEAPD